ncbi:S8 family serine peptidase [Vibrio viridaestus]|uniref:PKD domain-containing protein n=1 Tax=Vibrio viridaestus TaxID=2487322 RepID=A0A3N9TJE2_9VIBR|nr:S8 family serine peptidase [Vibrio viridaestus]RQW63983.1 PKD domain-containing protein [Vibrio viridaestus]
MKLMHFIGILAASMLSFAALAQPVTPTERYIVALKSDVLMPAQVASEIAKSTNGRIDYIYRTAFNGFSISIPPNAASRLSNDPRIRFIEKDIKVTAIAQTIPTGVQRIFPNIGGLSINSIDDFRVDADVAVLDTGIDLAHPDLNVVGDVNCLSTTGKGAPWKQTYICNTGGDDDHYHGTHVAGSIGALDNDFGVVGVAPGVRLWAVKILDASGSGSIAGIVAGIDWVVDQGKIEIINMSLGGSGTSLAMNEAIQNAYDAGILTVVAAGNSNMDASGFTPANAPFALTVSALADFDGYPGGSGIFSCYDDLDDTLASFSNWNNVTASPVINIAAPGVCITSTYPGGGYAILSGTSMASPHVAGAAALLASQDNSSITNPAQLYWNLLTFSGNFDWTDDSGDNYQEPLLDISSSNFTPVLVSTTSSNNPPVATYTYSCSELSCNFDASDSLDNDGIITSYIWNFGDGSNNQQSVTTTHTFSEEGMYSVTLTVMDNLGSSNSMTQSIDVATGSSSTSLSTVSINNGSTWTAIVADSNGSYLTGEWSTGASCLNQAQCELSGIAKKQSVVVFTSSFGEQIEVLKP